MRIALSLFVSLALLGCSGSETPEPTTTTTEPVIAAPATEPSPAEPATAEPAIAPATEPAAEPTTVPAVCGTRGASPCPAGTFCDYVAGSNCGADDRGGRCEPVPQMCTREFMPVCGCDGTTYPTACVAHSAAVSVAHDGPC